MKNFFKSEKKCQKIDDSFYGFDSFEIHMEHILHKRRFISAVHLRCPFEVSFLTTELVSITYHIGIDTYHFSVQVSEFEEIMSYALMHIDDVL